MTKGVNSFPQALTKDHLRHRDRPHMLLRTSAQILKETILKVLNHVWLIFLIRIILTLLQLTMSFLISLMCTASSPAPVKHGHKRMPSKCWCNYPEAVWETVVHITDFSSQLKVQLYGGTLVFITREAFLTPVTFQHHGQQHYLHSPHESLNLSTTNASYDPVLHWFNL